MNLPIYGWCIYCKKGIFRHGLGEEYFSRAKWIALGDRADYSIYIDKAGAEQIVASLVMMHPELIGDLNVMEVFKLPDGTLMTRLLADLMSSLDPELLQQIAKEKEQEKGNV